MKEWFDNFVSLQTISLEGWGGGEVYPIDSYILPSAWRYEVLVVRIKLMVLPALMLPRNCPYTFPPIEHTTNKNCHLLSGSLAEAEQERWAALGWSQAKILVWKTRWSWYWGSKGLKGQRSRIIICALCVGGEYPVKGKKNGVWKGSQKMERGTESDESNLGRDWNDLNCKSFSSKFLFILLLNKRDIAI